VASARELGAWSKSQASSWACGSGSRTPPQWLSGAGGEILRLRRRENFEIVGGDVSVGEREF
jgi:hypothetical protein